MIIANCLKFLTRAATLACIGLLSAAPLSANVIAFGAESVRFGVYCAAENTEMVPADGTVSGVVNLVSTPPPFVRGSNIVPAQRGIGFGVHLLVKPEFQGQITVETTHPPMGPEAVTRESWQTEVVQGNLALHGFTFEYPYELLPGDWSISASRDGRLIYHADFVIVDPNTVPPISCDGMMLS